MSFRHKKMENKIIFFKKHKETISEKEYILKKE